MNQSAESTAQMMGEEASATGDVAKDTERAADVNSEFMTRQAEMLREVWQCGGELASHFASRSVHHFDRALGVEGERSPEGVLPFPSFGALVQSGSAVARGAQAISAECVDLMLQRTQRSLEHADVIMGSKTAQDFTAAQTEAFRDQVESVIETARRIAEITLRTTHELSRQVKASASAKFVCRWPKASVRNTG